MSEFDVLYNQIGYRFRDESLLRLALTHSSLGGENYERLEFLGDALLDFAIGEYLYRQYPDKAEGELTKLRAQMVSNTVLYPLFDRLNLVSYVRSQNLALSKLSEKTRANFVESLLASIYLDGGMDAAKGFIERFICTESSDYSDYVSKLYEHCAIHKLPLAVEEESVGTVNKPRFKVIVKLGAVILAEATAGSIKQAKQAACKKALKAL